MNKTILLARSHLRKNRGTSVGILALMLISAMLLSLALLVLTDAYPSASREAQRLDAGDGFIRISGNVEGLDDGYLTDILEENTERICIFRCLSWIGDVPFAEGTMSLNLHVADDSAFAKGMGNTEIVEEDTSITSDYVYLPYQFYTSGGFHIGDKFTLECQGEDYDLTVRGFTTTPYFGCNNSGSYELVVDDGTYERMSDAGNEAAVIIYELKDGVKGSAFGIRISNKVLVRNPYSVFNIVSKEESIANRTFMSMIMAISFISITAIVLIVVLLMIVSSISNYIRENMKTFGALKAIGYTSTDLKASLLIMFTGLALIGSAVGIILSYVLMPVAAGIAVAQMGIPYKVTFHLMPSAVAAVTVMLFTFIVSEAALGKLRKIEPITALRDGTGSHNFRKNYFRLDRGSSGLDIRLALKTSLFNMKQNIITFAVVGVMVFLCVIGLLMYENFNVNPKVEMLTLEICGGVVAVDHETSVDAREFLEDIPGTSNIRDLINVNVYYKDEDTLVLNIFDDVSRMNNKAVCYDGRLPEYDNEVAVSGAFASEYGFDIGDEIELNQGGSAYAYLITGLIQTTNNGGREAIASREAAGHIIDLSYSPAYLWFDCESREDAVRILDAMKDEYGNHVISTMNFFEIMEGALTTFRGISTLMLALTLCISAVVILLVLFLLIKAFVLSKRRDYGIYKAIGFTSGNLMLQTALSFMPSIISSAVLFGLVSYFGANPFMNIVMGTFGIVKANFYVPWQGVAAICIAIAVISFVFAYIESGKIKKIEAYNMLIGE